MTKTQKQIKIGQISRILETVYPEAVCALEWNGEPWKLMVMGTLSAQCTDARVNLVSRDLFSRFPTARALADGDLSLIEEMIRSCGLFHTKAKNIQAACRMLEDEFGGVLPDRMEDLLRLPGVGRKVANLLLGDVYGTGGTVADTHCIRICGRFGMYPQSLKDPLRVEQIMNQLLPEKSRSAFCHRIVLFGRDTCTARSPKCSSCPVAEVCEGRP